MSALQNTVQSNEPNKHQHIKTIRMDIIQNETLNQLKSVEIPKHCCALSIWKSFQKSFYMLDLIKTDLNSERQVKAKKIIDQNAAVPYNQNKCVRT